MLPSLAIILLCQLLGEIITRGIKLPVPGPVLGMALMLLVLMARDRIGQAVPAIAANRAIETTGHGLLRNLSLMFVPAGVGVVQRLDILGAYTVPLALALMVSTVAALAAAAYTFVFVAGLVGAKEPGA